MAVSKLQRLDEMASEGHPAKPERHHSSRRGHRREHARAAEGQPRPLVRFVGKFWFEIVATALLILGVFLLVERFEIKVLVYRALVQSVSFAANVARSAWSRMATISDRIEGSDLVGVVLVLVAGVMIAYSLRRRAIARHVDVPASRECPDCHGELRRLPRGLKDRLVEFALRVRIKRYVCGKCSFRASVWMGRQEDE